MLEFIQQTPLVYFIDAQQRIFLPYLLSAGVLAGLFFILSKKSLPDKQRLKNYWLNDSARLDYGYFIAVWVFKLLLIVPFLLSAKTVALWVLQFIRPWLTPQFAVLGYESIALLYTLSLFVVSDFTRYWLHRWMHKSDFLWQFHQLHHSADSLNPITFYRVHPVENILFGLRYALSAGVVTGIFMAIFGAKLSVYTIFGVNALQLLFGLAGANLRHSAVFLSYGRVLEHCFISPAQHQLHHNVNYMQKNYGGYLAIWDWCFGSLQKASSVHKPLQLGLGEKHEFNSIFKCFWLPFFYAYKKVIQR